MSLTPGAILLGLALLVLVLLVVARPFLLRRAQEARPTSREALEAQKVEYLQQIADLDFDRETGKVPDAAYQQERQQLLLQAALVLRQLDTLRDGRQAAAEPKPPSSATANAEAQIEQAILALRQQRSANGGNDGYCPNCGRAVKAADNFCRSCGHSLQQER